MDPDIQLINQTRHNLRSEDQNEMRLWQNITEEV